MSRRRHDVNVLDKPLAKFERRLPALALPVRDSTPKEGALIPRRQPGCLLNGRHTPGSDWERECPDLRLQRAEADAKRSERPATAAGQVSRRSE